MRRRQSDHAQDAGPNDESDHSDRGNGAPDSGRGEKPAGSAASHTDSLTNASIPNRSASVALASSPASLISRSSSNATRTEWRFLGPAGTSAASYAI